MQDALAQARSVLEQRASELRAELAGIERAIAALAHPRRARSPQQRVAAQKRGRGKPGEPRRSRAEREHELIAYAKSNPQASNRTIAKALGVTPPYVTRLMRGLRESGTVRRKRGRLVVNE